MNKPVTISIPAGEVSPTPATEQYVVECQRVAAILYINPAHAARVIAERAGYAVDHEQIERWAKYADDPPA